MTGSIASTDDFYVVYRGKAIQTATHPSDRALTATDGTFTGDLTVDTNTLKVDSSNNRVAIGTTAGDAGASLTINKSPVAAHGNPLLQVGGSTFTSGGYYTIGLGYTNSTYTEPPAEISNISQSDSGGTKGAIVFGTRDVTTNTAVTERLRILSGGGLTFNGDTATANALDDYEEGTWTPTDATGSGVTWTTHSARYTKIGRIVNVQLYISGISSSAASATAKISGLPYNVVNHGWTSNQLSTSAGQVSSQDIVARSVSNSDDIDFPTSSTDTSIAWSHFHGSFMVFKLTYHVS